MKKLCCILLALALALPLCACGRSQSSASGAEAGAQTAPASASGAASQSASAGKSYVIGICQLVQHAALDAATKGFKDAVTAALGDAVTFEENNAGGDSASCATICSGFVSDGVDLILANATPSLQAAAAATDSIPVLGTAITEYGVALGLTDFSGTVGTNVSGTSDLAPLDQQAAMFAELLPDAKTVGILYCSAEPNSVYQADEVQKALEQSGVTVKIYTFADSNDVSSVTATACGECNALYIPTDNTAASCAETINNVALPAGVPIIAGEEGICKGCGIATLSIDYYELGRTTGEMAVRILRDGAKVSEMPVEYYADPVREYNADLCRQLNITVPDGYTAIAD